MGRKRLGKRVMTAKERMARSRARHRDDGGILITVRLSGGAARMLERLRRIDALNKTQFIEELITTRYRRVIGRPLGKRADPRRRRRLDPDRVLPEGVLSPRVRRPTD